MFLSIPRRLDDKPEGREVHTIGRWTSLVVWRRSLLRRHRNCSTKREVVDDIGAIICFAYERRERRLESACGWNYLMAACCPFAILEYS